MTEKGVCDREKIVYGTVTVSEKGQIAIPVSLRRDLDITAGEKLMALKREDKAGITFLKLDVIDELMNKIQSDEKFFRKLGGDKDADL